MKKNIYGIVFGLLLSHLAFAQSILTLKPFVSGFKKPIDIAHAGDNRLFIVEQDGYIWVVDSSGNRAAQPFLDIDARVRSTGGEQGLLGLAFHPDYQQNGFFYVNYTRHPDGVTRISRFSRSAQDPEKANLNSELVLMEVPQPYNNHNAGCLKFGPDGYLYLTMGDGGSGGDPLNSGQNRQSLLGKILRIDVDVDFAPYKVPPDNPFLGDTTYLPQIWSLGWRNPWRFSFDRLTGDMWIADVGQNQREEINFEAAGDGGRNYGWRCYEGSLPYNTNSCPPVSAFTPPVFEYNNPALGCSVTGGFVYRGARFPELEGMYIFADFCSGRWWGTRFSATDSSFTTVLLADWTNFEYVTFGEDKWGELYVSELSGGRILRVEGSPTGTTLPVSMRRIQLWPNPNNGVFTLSLEPGEEDVLGIEIFDSVGRLVSARTEDTSDGIRGIDLGGQPSGQYYVAVRTPDRVVYKSFYKN
jgi:glucose/arabinose dehydrogenase